MELVFDAEHWFWGILPHGQLLVNGKPPAGLRQPIVGMATPGFTLDVTSAAAGGTLRLALEIDGTQQIFPTRPYRQSRPHGVTGMFYLRATPLPVRTEPLTDWYAASAFNRLRAVRTGDNVECIYLETQFSLPANWPAQRLFLSTPHHLGFLVLNGYVVGTPGWMNRLDISGLVYRDGRPNVLRWVPASQVADWQRPYRGVVPELNLVWTK